MGRYITVEVLSCFISDVNCATAIEYALQNYKRSNVKAEWVWLPSSPAGGASGTTFTQALGNEGIAAADLVAREVLQNSWDAALCKIENDDTAFRFKFRFVEYVGNEHTKIVKTLGLSALLDQRKSLQSDARDIPELEDVSCLLDSKQPLRVLYLEDFGTHGMFGDPKNFKSSHLYKAMYILGSTSKNAEEGTRGGTFGFGKSAFIGASEVHTAIAYTRFAPRGDDNATRRLVGFTWWGDHEIGKNSYQGRAMFGKARRLIRDGAEPLVDKDADVMAEQLGMSVRSSKKSDLGSTVMIINPVINAEDLKIAVERNWWPALEDQLMDVVIETVDGTQLIPRPRSNKNLRPFLQAYGIARGLKTTGDEKTERLASSKWRADGSGRKYGELALVLDTDFDVVEASDDFSYGEANSPTVALIRGPKMVIEYKSFSSRHPIRGVFIADQSIDNHLRQVEPPAHNSWEKNWTKQLNKESKAVAKATMDRIRRSVKEFALEFSPPPSSFTANLPLLGSLLSGLFGGKALGKTSKPQPGSGPKTEKLVIRTALPDQRITVPGKHEIYLKKSISIKIPQSSKWEIATLLFAVSVSIGQEIEAKKTDDLIELNEVVAPQGFSRSKDSQKFEGQVRGGQELIFEITTMPYSKDLTAVVTPEVELFT